MEVLFRIARRCPKQQTRYMAGALLGQNSREQREHDDRKEAGIAVACMNLLHIKIGEIQSVYKASMTNCRLV